ncbi:MAG: hypothetical protein WCQ16_01075 [Verrucomicrobiae bacterium]
MNIVSIKDLGLRAQFQEIADMSEEELVALGFNSVVRDRLIARISLPDSDEDCWIWKGGFSGTGLKARPCIWRKGEIFLAYRVLMALVARKNIRDLRWILHKCPGGENCKCMRLSHLKEADSRESAAKENAQDRSRYGTLHGDRNGSRIHPETRPRGRNNPKSKFRGPGGERLIQTLRATYDAYLDKEGVIAELSRWTKRQGNKISGYTIGRLVRREIHADVPDDPAAALDPSQLHIQKRSESASKRKHWPSGDANTQTRVPLEAKVAFVILFHRTPQRAQKRVLIKYLAERYGVAEATAQGLGYVDPTSFGAPAKSEIQKLPRVLSMTPELLETTFGIIPPIPSQEEEQTK